MNTIQTPQKYVPRLYLKSQLRLRPSLKFQMHILPTSDKRLPMHDLTYHDRTLQNSSIQLAVLLGYFEYDATIEALRGKSC